MEFYKELFKSTRESQEMTQEVLAKKIGVTQQAIQQWEDGKSRPRPASVYAAARALGVPVSDISDLNLRGEAEKKDVLLNDPFIKIILDNWSQLTDEEKGRVAGIARSMAAQSAPISAPASAPAPASVEARPVEAKPETPDAENKKNNGPSVRCPHCHEYLYGSYVPGEKFSCPECGQHIVIHHIAKQEK